MIAYKAFNKDLQATMGKGIYQFEIGRTYEEAACKCAQNGFHCAENPLCTLTYYYREDTRFCIVDAGGDIDQDGTGSRISCTKMRIVKEIILNEVGMYGVLYMVKYPNRETESNYVVRDKGNCSKGFLIVRGSNPVAAGATGKEIS